MSLTRPEVAAPPALDFFTFYEQRRRHLRQGMHQLFVGPTQSGKTILCRLIARQRNPAVMLGTKPVDPSLDAYVAEGYVRIDHWPPRGSDYRKLGDPDVVRFILWPQMKKREDLKRFRPVYKACLDQIFVEGKWCIIADEGLWLADRKGLGLGGEVGDIAYGSASNKVSLYLCVQRPANIPPVAWTSVADAYIFHMGRTDDVRELASLGVYDPRAVTRVVQGLGMRDGRPNPGRSHEFLYLPCRGGGGEEWAISQVDPSLI